MTGDSHDLTPTPAPAAGVSSAAERLARAAAVLAEAEATAAAKGSEVDGAAGSSALGLAWVDSPDDVPTAGSFADLLAQASGGDPPTGGERGRSRPGRWGAQGHGAGQRDGARRGRRGRRRGADEAAVSTDGGSEGSAASEASTESTGSGAPASRRSSAPQLEPEAEARAIVLRQLTMSPRSRAQLERKLSERGCDEDVAARVLDRLTEVGLVDDEAYAQMLVRVRHTDKGLARRALSHELRRHGIDPELADVALLQVGDGDERVRAEQLVEKRLRTLHGLSPEVQSRRLAGLLARKGYSSEIAYPVIRDAVAGAQEHRRD